MDLDPGILSSALLTGGVILVVLVVALLAISRLIIIVPPNSAAVITGRKRVLPDGDSVGYRSVIGGRTLRIPIIEEVEWVSLESIPIEISVLNAFSKGNIPLTIEAIANVKIASEPESVFNNAVERLLDKTHEQIKEIARDTLMGNLRGVLATLTPEEVNEDRLGFAKALAEDAGDDLAALGFHLDVLKIQNVSDERGYLEAIGRKKAAEAVRDAEIAEADADSTTRERQADARQRAEVREAQAGIEIAEAQNLLRVRQAQLDQEALTAEKIAKVRAEEAEIQAQKTLESRRVEREQERLRADVVAPAEAQREAAQALAEAEAAPILERGRANVKVLEMLYEKLSTGGEQAFAVFLAEKMPELLRISVDAVKDIDIDRLVVLDGGDGGGVNNAANQRVRGAMGTIEGLSASLGIDIEGALRGATGRLAAGEDSLRSTESPSATSHATSQTKPGT
ncbi:MAG: flotillin family protein [Gemmatimonadota bacterium]